MMNAVCATIHYAMKQHEDEFDHEMAKVYQRALNIARTHNDASSFTHALVKDLRHIARDDLHSETDFHLHVIAYSRVQNIVDRLSLI